MSRLRRLLIFYSLCVCSNIGVMYYELNLVGMTFEQSLFARAATLLTDIVETVLFIETNVFDDLSSTILRKVRVNLVYYWIEKGFKLAMIGPTIYVIKLFFLSIFLTFCDIGIEPFGISKIWCAYLISLFLSFGWGATFAVFERRIEKSASFIKRRVLMIAGS